MSFMQPQVTDRMDWIELETSAGTFFFPANEVGTPDAWQGSHVDEDDGVVWQNVSVFYAEYVEPGARLESAEITTGFGARLSAPGYMDRTDWTVHETAAEAAGELLSAYYDQADEDMADEERDEAKALQAIIDA